MPDQNAAEILKQMLAQGRISREEYIRLSEGTSASPPPRPQGSPAVSADPYQRTNQPVKKNSPGVIIAIVAGVIIASSVPVIAILAAIAVPNFLEAQVRAKVARTRADLRSLHTAIEAYKIDHGVYPAASGTLDQALPSSLTTPTAYLTGLFPDPFGERKESVLRYYAARDGRSFYVWSVGPDGQSELLPDDLETLTGALPFAKIYDPSNGTTSRGDVVRVGVADH